MKLKTLLVATAITAIAIPTVAGAANTRDAVTGGGQAFFDMRDPSGAGDTIAFTAKREKGAEDGSTDAVGQIQVRRRGTNAVKFHGAIECLVVNGTPGSSMGTAYMSGTTRANKDTPAQPFELYVSDGGRGQDERSDMIMLFVGAETANNDGDGEDVCGFSDPNFDTVSMARGNVQVRNRNESEDAEPASQSESTALSLPGLL